LTLEAGTTGIQNNQRRHELRLSLPYGFLWQGTGLGLSAWQFGGKDQADGKYANDVHHFHDNDSFPLKVS
jgi:hypothetical protein